MRDYERVIRAIAELGEDARGLSFSFGADDHAYEALAAMPGASLETSVYDAAREGETPHAIDWVGLPAGRARVTAQRRSRPCTEAELDALINATESVMKATTIVRAA